MDMPILTAEELEIVVDLLEEEHRNLPAEIHHSQTPDTKTRLHARLKTVERLLERMRQGAGSPS